MDTYHRFPVSLCEMRPMATAATVPVTIAPEAEDFIAQVGQRREFEAMIDRARETLPDLRAIKVTFEDFPETGPPSVVLWVHRAEPGPHGDWADWDYGRWQ